MAGTLYATTAIIAELICFANLINYRKKNFFVCNKKIIESICYINFYFTFG